MIEINHQYFLSNTIHRACLMVKDKGIGISDADQKKIVEKFERAVFVKDYRGLGLVLYITSEIVKAHHGSIKLESSHKTY
jgi:signal transduction histidine kinase